MARRRGRPLLGGHPRARDPSTHARERPARFVGDRRDGHLPRVHARRLAPRRHGKRPLSPGARGAGPRARHAARFRRAPDGVDALQRRALRSPGPLLGRHPAHGRAGSAAGGLALPLRPGRLAHRPARGRPGDAERAGLVPRRAPHVPLRFPCLGEPRLVLRLRPRLGPARQPARLHRHVAARRPPRRRGRGRGGLLLDLRQRWRRGAPLHARGQARSTAHAAGIETHHVRLRRRAARDALRHHDETARRGPGARAAARGRGVRALARRAGAAGARIRPLGTPP